MDELYAVLKGSLDPLFIVVVLLVASFIIFWLKSKKKSDTLLLLLGIIFLYGAGIFPVANYLCYYLEKDYIRNQNAEMKNIDAIVVLGNGTKDINTLKETFSTETGYLRLVHAVEVYHKTGARYFVCSGGGDGLISEAETMARLAERLGVPKEKIKMETRSDNTSENASELNKMMSDKNIHIGLVTSAYHMKRSERELSKYFNNILPLPAHYLYESPKENVVRRYMPQAEELHKTSIAIKEIVGQLWYKLK